MSSEESKTVIERMYQALNQAFRTGNMSGLDEVFPPDFRHHVPGMPVDREGLKQMLPAFRAAFPDIEMTMEEIVAEGDRVADRCTWRATHRGDLMGIPPTGKQVTVSESHFSRVANGKVVERWGDWDQMGLMQQLGVIPTPGGAG